MMKNTRVNATSCVKESTKKSESGYCGKCFFFQQWVHGINWPFPGLLLQKELN